jgi:ribosomal protein S27E
MKIKAECSNPKCSAFGIEKSVVVGQMRGYGAPNDRVTCPVCGELMKQPKP